MPSARAAGAGRGTRGRVERRCQRPGLPSRMCGTSPAPAPPCDEQRNESEQRRRHDDVQHLEDRAEAIDVLIERELHGAQLLADAELRLLESPSSRCCSGVKMREVLSLRRDCSAASLSSVWCSWFSSSCSSARKRWSAIARSRSTRVKGRVKAARPRTLIRSALPVRLSSAFATKSPLLAQGVAIRCPKRFCSRTQR